MDFDLTHGSAILARTPATLHALLDGLDTSWTSVIVASRRSTGSRNSKRG